MQCNVCGIECDKTCSRCKSTAYCCEDHQRSDWKSHKLLCALNARCHHRLQQIVLMAATGEAKEYLYTVSMYMYLKHGHGTIVLGCGGDAQLESIVPRGDARLDYDKYTIVTEDKYVEYTNYRIDHRLQYNPMTTFAFGISFQGSTMKKYINVDIKSIDDKVIVFDMLSRVAQEQHPHIHTIAEIFNLLAGIFHRHIDDQVRISYANYKQHHRGCIYYDIKNPSDLVNLDYYPLTFVENSTAAIQIVCKNLLYTSDVL